MADTLGETLKERRKQLGIPLPQVEEQLHIRARTLEALEEGNYERLPNPGYVRGYVSTYARYLELDPAPLLAMYHAETGHGRFHRIEVPEQAVKPRGEQHALSWRAALAAVAVIAVASLVVWGVMRMVQGPEQPPPIAPEPTATVSPETSASTGATGGTGSAASSTVPTTPAEATPAPAKPKTFVLKVEIGNGESWLEVKIDGATKFADVAAGPTSKTYKVTKSADVKIGRPSVVTVYRDGTEVPVTEKNGIGVVTLSTTPSTQ
jgi:cytoskeleton protein RodZ